MVTMNKIWQWEGHRSQSRAGKKSRNARDFITDRLVPYLVEEHSSQYHKYPLILQTISSIMLQNTLLPSLWLSEWRKFLCIYSPGLLCRNYVENKEYNSLLYLYIMLLFLKVSPQITARTVISTCSSSFEGKLVVDLTYKTVVSLTKKEDRPEDDFLQCMQCTNM